MFAENIFENHNPSAKFVKFSPAKIAPAPHQGVDKVT